MKKSSFNSGANNSRGNVRGKYRSEFSGDQTFDYKDAVSFSRFISDGGKITPARLSKLSIAQQKQVAAAVKKARNLGLLPTGSDAYDTNHRIEPINRVPFEV